MPIQASEHYELAISFELVQNYAAKYSKGTQEDRKIMELVNEHQTLLKLHFANKFLSS